MSDTAMQAISEFARAPISGTAFRTLYLLADAYNDAERCASPSIATLMTQTGKSDRSVGRAVDELVAHKIIDREIGGGRYQTNRYRIPIVESMLDGNPRTFDENPRVIAGVTPGETPAEMTVYSEETPALLTENPRTFVSRDLGPFLVPGESLTQGLKDARDVACVREEVSKSAAKPKQPREVADTPRNRLIKALFDRWPPTSEPFSNARDRLIHDIDALLAATKDDDAEALAAVGAFSAGVEGGGRPDYRFVIRYIGRWRLAGKLETFHPFTTPLGGSNGKSRTTSLVNADRRPDGTERFGGETQAANDRTLRRIAERHRVPAV